MLIGASARRAILGATPAFLGQVATRCFVPGNTAASTAGWNCRTAHVARDNISALQVVFGKWYTVAATGDANAPGTQTVTATIEYPAGVYNRLRFGGSNSAVNPSGGNLVSDVLPVNIPKGAVYWSKRYQVNSVGVEYCSPGSPTMNLAMGDAVNSNSIDETASPTVDNGNGGLVPPQAIVAYTRQPSIGIVGSSRFVGFKDSTVDATGDTGYCRLIGDVLPYINAAVSSDTMASVAANSPKRLALIAAYCSHLWIDPGMNDIGAGTSAATILGYIASIAATWPKLNKVIINDEGPYTTSTDSWATLANQTASAFEAARISLNSGIVGLLGYNQIVKLAALDTDSGSSFAWVSNGSVFGRTPDGVHENTAQLLLMKAANPFDGSRIR